MITSIEEKAFWAMNTHMAINNVLNIIQHVTSIEGYKKELEDPGYKELCENKLFTWLADTYPKDYQRKRKVLARLWKFLPISKVYVESLSLPKRNKGNHTNQEVDKPVTMETLLETPFPRDKFVNFLKATIFVLYELRNYFSHYDHEMYKLQDDKSDSDDKDRSHLYFLYTLLTANLRTVKQRFYKDRDDMSCEVLFDPFRQFKGKKSAGSEDANKPKPNPNFKFELFNENKTEFTTQGLVFFLCQFLEKKYAQMMLQSPYAKIESKPNPFRRGDTSTNQEPDEQLRARLCTVHSLILPKERLEMTQEQTPGVRGMDILNELHRCPADLFELLPPADQNMFRLKAEDGKEILMKRHADRFTWLALNYLDRSNKLETIRFHIDMGPYYFASSYT